MTKKFSNPRLVVLAYSRQLNGETGLIDKGILISAISRVPDTKNIRDALDLIVRKTPDSEIRDIAQKKLDDFATHDQKMDQLYRSVLARMSPLLEAPQQLPLSFSIFDDGALSFANFDEGSPKLRSAIEEIDAINPNDSKKLHLLLSLIVLNYTDDLPKLLLDAADRKVAEADSKEVMRIVAPLLAEFLALLTRGIYDDSVSEETCNAPRVIERCSSLFRSYYSSSVLRAAIENIRDDHPDSKIRGAFEKLFPKNPELLD